MSDERPPSDETSAWGPAGPARPVGPMSGRDAKSDRTTDASPGAAATEQAPADVPLADGLRFIRELGRGGLGSVWLAMQETEGFRRTVAVKLVRRGMDTDDILRRFALERQVLGALEHPNIVRLYGAGSTRDGRPYFVMEHVEGLPIDRYCDERRLGIERRLELFIGVCRAVQHAHTRLVVHRDLKPSNVLVAADGTVKLLDFGIARLVDRAVAPVVVDPTAPDARILTPDYASPEQIRGAPIGTASDVYSLGVILFELLTGHRPYRIRTRVMRELERIVCEEDPLVPSTVVDTPAEAVTVETSGEDATRVVTRPVDPETISRSRGAAVEALRRRLRGDLDVITLRALAKSPDQRYPTPEAFAADLLRHLRGEPIEARAIGPLGRAYRFVRRNRGKVAVSALVAAAGVALLAGAYFRERARTEESLRAAQAELAALRLEQVRELSGTFLDRFYNRLRALEGGAEVRGMLAEVVARQIEALEKQDALGGGAVADVEFMRLLALSHRGLGRVRGDVRGESGCDYAAAREAFRRSDAILGGLLERQGTGALGASERRAVSVDRMQTLVLWADVERAAGSLAEARRFLLEAETIGAIHAADASPAERQRRATVLLELGEIADRMGEPREADVFFTRSLELRRANLAAAPDDLDAARAVAKALASMRSRSERGGDVDAMLAISGELLAIRGRLAAARPADARIARELMLSQLAHARTLVRAGRADEAIGMLEAAAVEATARVERAPDSHESLSDRALAYETAAQVLGEIGRLEEALARQRLARADLVRAAAIAPAIALYMRREAYLGALEARILGRLGRVDEAMPIAAGAAERLEKLRVEVLRAQPSGDADLSLQSAVACAIGANLAGRQGDAERSRAFEARARVTVDAMPEAARADALRYVEAELALAAEGR